MGVVTGCPRMVPCRESGSSSIFLQGLQLTHWYILYRDYIYYVRVSGGWLDGRLLLAGPVLQLYVVEARVKQGVHCDQPPLADSIRLAAPAGPAPALIYRPPLPLATPLLRTTKGTAWNYYVQT